MFDFLNQNQGVIAIVALLVNVIIVVVGFKINKNITKITDMKQDVSGDNSKAMMAGRDATDNSNN